MSVTRNPWDDMQAGFGRDCLGGIDPDNLAAYWLAFGLDLTAEWIARHPGTRPWSWWNDSLGMEPPPWGDQAAELVGLGEVDLAEVELIDRREREWSEYMQTVRRRRSPSRSLRWPWRL